MGGCTEQFGSGQERTIINSNAYGGTECRNAISSRVIQHLDPHSQERIENAGCGVMAEKSKFCTFADLE